MATAKDLRAKAAKLVKQAEQMEAKKLLEIGKLVQKYHDAHFKDFHLESFKKEVAKLLE